MHMAWIGMVDEASGLVRPVAADGAGADDLDGIAISVDAGTPAGLGPTGTAIRERRPVWCQDFRNDASTAPWHERGERHGWAASAALPLLRDGRPVGALTLFAVAANAFDEEVRGLLQQMAADITFGLDTFARDGVRRRTEVALRDSEYRWRFALEGAGDGLWDWDMLTGMVYFSRQWKAMLGFAENEITDRFEEWEKRVHPDDLPQAMAALQAHLDGRTPLYFNENRVGCKDGSWKWILERGLVVRRDAGGKPVRMIGTHTDVTARRQAESSLRLRSAALDAAANAIVITDRQGTIEWVNRAFSALTGYSPEEALGRNPRELVKSGVHSRAFYDAMWQTLVAGGVWEGELTNRRKDGSRYVEEQTITPVKNAGGEITHFIGVKRDLTEYKRLQQQFLQAQKMEVVGRLAGGIAHDFNNLLTVINGTADLALIELSPDDPLRAEFALIQQAGSRAGRLTRQLLAFSRKQILAPAVLNVGAQVANAASMLRRLIGEDIDLVVATPDQQDLDSVLVDPGQLEQVLLNLVVNARDAMPTGGSLTIETRNVTLDAAFAAAHAGVVPGPYVLLSVTDTGVGMTADVRARIFEPFFTTKERGKGTGLGLATVYGIVHQSGGCIVVETEPGHGASFKIFLPKVEPADTTRPGATPPCVHGTETVLLVEDEDGLCQVATRMLLSAGYTVIQARSGQEALATLDHRDGPVHLLFADVVMPGMSGPDLASRLAGRYPDMRVLFTSGYVGDDPLSRAVRADTSHFIAKPYTVADVTRKIRDVLDAPPTS
jgi:PAS domain S-box-containing protein